jgi:hypothetical protein
MSKTKALGLAAALVTFLIAGGTASATTYQGQVIKGSGPSIYYVTKKNERLVFPDEITFKTWYPNFNSVIKLSDSDVNATPLVGTVAVKPGSVMIRAKGDNQVYAVARYGVKRPITSPTVARIIYGINWPNRVAVVSPASLAEYVPGGVVAGPDQFWWMREENAVKTIDDNYEPSLNSMHQVVGTVATGTATLTLKATVINGNDGRTSATDTDMSLFIEALPVRSGKTYAIKPGAYTVYDTDVPGYVISGWSGDCNQSSADSHAGYVSLNMGDHKNCSVTYTYSVTAWQLPTLTVSVNVLNNYDGKLLPNDFSLFVGSNYVKSGEAHQYGPKTYKLTVSGAPTVKSQALYTPLGWSGDCNSDGTIELKRGQTYSCVFTYADVAAHAFNPTMGQLVLSAVGAPVNSVRLFLEGRQVTAGQLIDVDPRDYTVYDTDALGYNVVWQGDCVQSTSDPHAATVKGEVLKYKSCTAVYTKK